MAHVKILTQEVFRTSEADLMQKIFSACNTIKLEANIATLGNMFWFLDWMSTCY